MLVADLPHCTTARDIFSYVRLIDEVRLADLTNPLTVKQFDDVADEVIIIFIPHGTRSSINVLYLLRNGCVFKVRS